VQYYPGSFNAHTVVISAIQTMH